MCQVEPRVRSSFPRKKVTNGDGEVTDCGRVVMHAPRHGQTMKTPSRRVHARRNQKGGLRGGEKQNPQLERQYVHQQELKSMPHDKHNTQESTSNKNHAPVWGTLRRATGGVRLYIPNASKC